LLSVPVSSARGILGLKAANQLNSSDQTSPDPFELLRLARLTGTIVSAPPMVLIAGVLRANGTNTAFDVEITL
jgi:hypothetical protein